MIKFFITKFLIPTIAYRTQWNQNYMMYNTISCCESKIRNLSASIYLTIYVSLPTIPKALKCSLEFCSLTLSFVEIFFYSSLRCMSKRMAEDDGVVDFVMMEWVEFVRSNSECLLLSAEWLNTYWHENFTLAS